MAKVPVVRALLATPAKIDKVDFVSTSKLHINL